MPEGDTVYLSAERLHRALAGDELVTTDFRVPRYATLDMSGRRVEEVTSRGKHILFRISEDLTLHTHFKMDGVWDLYRRGRRWRNPAWQARVVLETGEWTAVGFRLPVLDVLPRSHEDEFVGHLGPDPLREWDSDKARLRLEQGPDRSIADALLDQRVIAGLGNVYKSEICFLRGLDPDMPVARAGDLGEIVALAARLLQANRDTGRQVTTGDPGPGRTSWVYGRAGEPCRRCRTTIEKSKKGPDRVTYWCPSCQPRVGRIE